MLTDTTIKRLDTLGALSQAGKRINGLFRLMENPMLWQQAYANIHANYGATTPGVDGKSLDGFSEARVLNLIEQLKEGRYHFKPAKRVYIPKTNGKQRPLGIASGDDKLVQEIVRMMLEKIYEPIFQNSSHGFRPEKSCHTALSRIKQQWTSVKWIVDMDIKSFYDTINHQVLIKSLEKKIDDVKFIKLIQAMLVAGYMEDWKFHTTYSGTPQGNIASPILSNIYLHELDILMNELRQQFNQGKRRAEHTEYRNISEAMRRRMVKIDKLKNKAEQSEAIAAIKTEIKLLEQQRKQLPSSDAFDANYRRLFYCRYADDFLIGIIGSKQEAMQIMEKIKHFIKETLQLEIAEEKSSITHAKEGAGFLGYQVKTYTGHKVVKTMRGHRHTTARVTSERIQLHIPEAKLRQFCHQKKYGQYDIFKPIHRSELINLSDAEIIKTYNAELRGIVNYYSLATNASKMLGKLRGIWRGSLLKTLARKHKTKVNKIIKQLKTVNGEMLTVHAKTKTFTFKLFQLKDKRTAPAVYHKIDYTPNTWQFTLGRSELIQRMSANQCEYCGQQDGKFEVHHIRKLKDIMKGKKLWQITMIQRQRKTLVLCIPCHKALHAGNLPNGIKTQA